MNTEELRMACIDLAVEFNKNNIAPCNIGNVIRDAKEIERYILNIESVEVKTDG